MRVSTYHPVARRRRVSWCFLLAAMTSNTTSRGILVSWEEQDRFFQELPAHLQRIALYKVNTGCRKQEVLQLRWNWEVQVPKLGTRVFVLPINEQFQTKNSQERVVVLNAFARHIIDEQRGKHGAQVRSHDDTLLGT